MSASQTGRLSVTHLKGNSSGSLHTPPHNTQHQHPEKNSSRPADPKISRKAVRAKTALFPSITKPCKLASSGWRSGPALPVFPRFLAPSFSSADSGLCHARSLGEPGPGLGSCRRTASERTPGLCSDCGFSAPLPDAREARGPPEAGTPGGAHPDLDTVPGKRSDLSLPGGSWRA